MYRDASMATRAALTSHSGTSVAPIRSLDSERRSERERIADLVAIEASLYSDHPSIIQCKNQGYPLGICSKTKGVPLVFALDYADLH